MEKAVFVNASYVESDTKTVQGKRTELKQYFSRGYKVVEDRNGFWILSRPNAVNVEVKSYTGCNTFNMKQDILNHYNRQRMTEKLFEKFYEEALQGKLQFYIKDRSCLLR